MFKSVIKAMLSLLASSKRVRIYLKEKWGLLDVEDVRKEPEKVLSAMEVKASGMVLKFFPYSRIPIWRYDTLYTKEPETLEWIDSFSGEDIFWDIGANVGIYSIYAAVVKEVRTLAFEPGFANYFILNKNIELNRVDSLVSAYCLAFSLEDGLGFFNMGDTEAGGAIHHFGEEREEIACGEMVKNVEFRQAMLGYSIDSFVEKYGPPFPNHIKIDVDGIEDKIIEGALQTLKDKRFKSLSIEIDESDEPYLRKVDTLLRDCGLRFLHKKHSAMFDTGKFKSLYNFVYQKSK